MQKSKQFYDKFYSNYPLDVHDNAPRFLAVSQLLSGNVLDVACGTGTLSKYYAGAYVGLDISDVAIKKAAENRRKDAKFMALDFTKSRVTANGEYDCAYLGEFLEHIEKDEFVFENVIKLLKPNAKIIVSVPNGDRIPDKSHCREFTVPQIRRVYAKYGKIRFHNWEGFADRILFSIELGQKNEDELTLVMIVKDEQKGLEKAILSALPIVDNVVISVDSKSRDNTELIARRYADEIKFHEWENDFSKARNFAQFGVTSKWILFLDGHEFIESYGDYKEKIQFDVEGIFVTIRMESNMTFLYPRIYRSHIQFKNKVHNLNECKTRRAAPEFVIVHDRVNGQDEDAIARRDQQRNEMMPNELKKQIKDNPKNSRAHFHLANYYMMRKNPKMAMKHYKKVIKYGKSNDEKYVSLLHFGALHDIQGHWFRALINYNKALNLCPDRWEALRVIGGFYYMQRDFLKALDYLVDSLTPNKRRYSYEPIRRNYVDTWDLIGQCFAQTDQNQKAITAWERAIELCDESERVKLFKQKIKLVKTLLS